VSERRPFRVGDVVWVGSGVAGPSALPGRIVRHSSILDGRWPWVVELNAGGTLACNESDLTHLDPPPPKAAS
jgi:hypothetical protein